jgi:hypothetical protein
VYGSSVISAASPTSAEFIVSVVVAGVLGPFVGFLAGRGADRRRFAHERGLKASDDLVGRIDDVAASFESLREACARLRVTCLVEGADAAVALQCLHDAEGAHIKTRALISRLGIRPHADEPLVRFAFDGAASMLAAIENVRNASTHRRAMEQAAGQAVVLGVFDDQRFESCVNDAQQHMQAFESRARATVGKLLAP